MDRNRTLSKLLVVHAVVTFAAGVALIVAPAAIPRSVGIRLEPSANLIAYLLAGAEFGLAVLSYGARQLKDNQAMNLIVMTFIVFHGSTAALEAYAFFASGVGAAIWANVVARAAIIGLFVYFGAGPRSEASKLG